MTQGYFEQSIMRELFKDDPKFLGSLEPYTSTQRAKYALLRIKRLQGELDAAKVKLAGYRNREEEPTLF